MVARIWRSTIWSMPTHIAYDPKYTRLAGFVKVEAGLLV